jgi:sulfoxide reductase heme-binding subunit YedZ
MNWLKKNWEWLLLNTIALVIFMTLLLPIIRQIRDISDVFFFGNNAFRQNEWIGSEIFRHSGQWAIRFLVLSLAMSPLYYLFGWKAALKLRKPAGLWAFAFAVLHFRLFFADYTWGKITVQTYYWLGLAAISILAILAATSFTWSQRLLKKWWKRLHRLVYVAGLIVVLHSILALGEWQKFSDWDLLYLETRVYAVLVIALLVLRIRWVRNLLQIPKRKRKVKVEFLSNEGALVEN